MIIFLLALWTFIATCWVRFIIWLLAMIVAVIPAVHVAKVHFSSNLESMADGINKAGHFHEFYFVVIIAAIFGISNIIYSAIFVDRRISLWVGPAFTTSLLFFLYAVVFGILQFADIAEAKGTVGSSDFQYDVAFIQFTLLIGVFTEITIAFRERFS